MADFGVFIVLLTKDSIPRVISGLVLKNFTVTMLSDSREESVFEGNEEIPANIALSVDTSNEDDSASDVLDIVGEVLEKEGISYFFMGVTSGDVSWKEGKIHQKTRDGVKSQAKTRLSRINDDLA
jgi:hypothetical protein